MVTAVIVIVGVFRKLSNRWESTKVIKIILLISVIRRRKKNDEELLLMNECQLFRRIDNVTAFLVGHVHVRYDDC